MPLDFRGYDASGAPVGAVVSMPVSVHAALGLHERAHPLLGRLADPYGDARFAHAELSALERELVALGARAHGQRESDVLAALGRLLHTARTRGWSIRALGD